MEHGATLTDIDAEVGNKGVQGSECWTRGWVGRLAIGRKKDFWNPLQDSPKLVFQGDLQYSCI
ncbi:uncharacterized protein LACBIDRAFT_304365 [Laccaria bicolor S238N-H82]|uniref:Predicted protein n=1 Tax=Laccaria bicolor (strain S238N-H82 / ATCC MYA-4686) TaxID=486041 RepID=B0DLH2_LACBS|nr:uncharacterized protein LACBIDRAFT_304365 [Laccaria bicolor S238N-H82]EDR04647.1 predicted protein [Laccaria bicolor S238N-H82]|eukprot:XP_001884819.1 predicted protein [Laccaria bicolor S238N-H82]